MKVIITCLLIFISLLGITQENENSLLWKITNPNTQKTSYLYGTMHISGRLAFHLGEEFFDAITEVDAIALESNPIIWLDEIFNSKYASDYLGRYGFQYQTYKGFYQDAFKLKIPKNKNLSSYLASDHYLSNWMLYRENKSKLDFEEETFLDLFIYQTGMKNDKKVYSLEDFSQTTELSKLGSLPDPNDKEPAAWFEKLIEDKDARDLIEDAYRNKNVMLLDSLHGQINSNNFVKYMLDVRNNIMAARIDSFIQKEDISLFIGIGAAHLGGKYGVIQYLADKGYSLEAMPTTITDQAKQIKETFDHKTTNIFYNNLFESDFFSVKVPGSMFETPSNNSNQRQFFSPELTNGSYFSIKQISTYSYLTKLQPKDYELKIDSLLYESIPGNIISKAKIEIDGFSGLDILNETTSGNFQRYMIIYSPINIFIFKMGGKKDFVKKQSDGFFKSIVLKPILETNWKTAKAFKGDFSVEVPNYYHIKNNNKITSLYNHPELEAYDINNDAYYLVKRSALHDFKFIETDTYELNRLIEKFLKELDIDSCEIIIEKSEKYPTATAFAKNANNERIDLKFVIKGPFYYLLACVNASGDDCQRFFKSFKFDQFQYNFPFVYHRDSTLLFSVNSNYLYPTAFNDTYTKAYRLNKKNESKDKVDNSYKNNSESRIYYSENFERIAVEAYKYHNYSEFDNIDSLWANERAFYEKDKKLIVRQFNPVKDKDLFILNLELTDTNSSRMILAKYILKHGMLYSIKSNVDTLSPKSKFIELFFSSFTPFDTMVGTSVFEDKSKLFLKDIYSYDSLIKTQALESVRTHVNFDSEDFDEMKKMILNYPFTAKQIDIKKQMITDLGNLEKVDITDFMEDLYHKSEDTSMYQIAILEALAKQSTKKSTELFLKLLEHDIPLASDNYATYRIFRPFYDSLEIASHLYPKILDYTFVKQYKAPIYELLAFLVEKEKIKPSSYKKSYNQILREAKIELKSQISLEQNNIANENESEYRYESYKNRGNDELVHYSALLLPFYDKADVNLFYTKLTKVQDLEIQTDIAVQKMKNNIPVNDSIWIYLASNLINRNYLYKALSINKKLDLFPQSFTKQTDINESLLYDSDFNVEKDSFLFVDKREVIVQNDTGYVYFYKSKKEKDDDWYLDYIGLQPLDQKLINISSQFEETRIKIEKYKDISEVIEEQVRSIVLEGHPRAKKEGKENYNWYY